MELNFDKEIDAILRKARDGQSAFTAAANPSSHPDADELNAFAENALPEKAKMRAVAHLADCDRCRNILSNLITLRPAAEIEIDLAGQKTIVAASLPWYRRLFQFPNLAYSLGALTLVFAGLIGFMALQSFDRASNSEVSQMSEKPLDSRSAPMQSNTNFAGTTTNTTNTTNSSTSNASVPGNVNSAPVYSSNTSAPVASSPAANTNIAPVKSADAPVETKEAQRKDEDEPASRNNSFTLDGASGASQKQQAQPQEENKVAATPKNESDDKLSQTEPQPADSTALSSVAKKSRATMTKPKKTDSAEGETTVAGGKTFRRSGSVWYDAAYNNQPTINVTRGTSAYKKLDRDLQLIAENLGGTVVIAWKGKAYRIR